MNIRAMMNTINRLERIKDDLASLIEKATLVGAERILKKELDKIQERIDNLLEIDVELDEKLREEVFKTQQVIEDYYRPSSKEQR